MASTWLNVTLLEIRSWGNMVIHELTLGIHVLCWEALNELIHSVTVSLYTYLVINCATTGSNLFTLSSGMSFIKARVFTISAVFTASTEFLIVNPKKIKVSGCCYKLKLWQEESYHLETQLDPEYNPNSVVSFGIQGSKYQG